MNTRLIHFACSKALLFVFGFLLLGVRSMAQLPSCIGANAGLIYYASGTSIYNLDPTQPISATNPVLNTISLPTGAAGLSLGNNLNAPGPSPTFYTTVSGNYFYYNGVTWVNTTYTVGGINPGAGGNFIYNVGGAGVYSYNGSSNSTVLVTPSASLSGDVVGDCQGNFYVLGNNSTTNSLYEYSSSGTLFNTWTVNGAPTVLGSGMAVINNNLYFSANLTTLYGGSISGTTITVSSLGTLSQAPSDFASCPVGAFTTGKTDTVYVCSGGAAVQVTAAGSAPFTWTVLSGPAVITGSGATVNVTSSANSVIAAQSPTACGIMSDTFKIVVPTALVSTGLPLTVTGCGTYTDTLNAHLTDTVAGLTYLRAWSPAIAIASGGNTLTPVTHLFTNTKFTLTVSTPATQGACTFTDTGSVYVINKSVKAKFADTLHYSCIADTIYLTNQSTGQTSQLWNLGDNTTSTALNPVHTYPGQGHYSVLLTVTNGTCTDSVRTLVDTPHSAHASFTVSADSICQGQTITFTNTSIGVSPSYLWNFSDGTTDTSVTPNHTFTNEGVYLVKLFEKDFASCKDSTTMQVIVDSISAVSFTTSDSVLCQGQGITFTGKFTKVGLVSSSWDFGDGTVVTNKNPINHGYQAPGTYPVILTTNFRICPSITLTKSISVSAFPAINVGADTSMCPNGNPIQLVDAVNIGNPAAHWQWNTGDTSAITTATQPGVYYATVTINGCSASDSVWVKNDCYLSIPNTFTPNNDGVNDYFFPRQKLASGVSTFKLDVFNRWGQLVFETLNIDGRGWDGKFNSLDQPVGVYIYTIDVSFKDGETESYKGNVTLLR